MFIVRNLAHVRISIFHKGKLCLRHDPSFQSMGATLKGQYHKKYMLIYHIRCVQVRGRGNIGRGRWREVEGGGGGAGMDKWPCGVMAVNQLFDTIRLDDFYGSPHKPWRGGGGGAGTIKPDFTTISGCNILPVIPAKTVLISTLGQKTHEGVRGDIFCLSADSN